MSNHSIIRAPALTMTVAAASLVRGGAKNEVATVTAKVLKVEDAPPNTTVFPESNVGKRLAVGSNVSTGKRAKAEITLDDKSFIRMGQTSDVVINPNREIDLPKGTIKFNCAGGPTINNEWLLRAYKQLGRNLSELITLDQRTGDSAKVGAGIVYKFRFN